MNKQSILIFGAAKLQLSLIRQAKKMGLYTIAVDPDPHAECNSIVDLFEVVDGNDFEGTLEIAKRFRVSGLVTTATDKPLVMMARIAMILEIPFFSVTTAEISTDKFLMKEAFLRGNILCAKGKKISSLKDIVDLNFPVILKPRDNSGSRGVILCNSYSEMERAFSEVKQFTKKETILVEEYIEGKEYSVESLHFNKKSLVIQYTEKITTPPPYNVELGHNQPANFSSEIKNEINIIISKIGKVLGYTNCASHTELKINNRGIFVIETSPRLGGDYITSHLVPLSTGINMEDSIIKIAIGQPVSFNFTKKASLVAYLNFPFGKEVLSIISEDEMKQKFPEIVEFQMTISKRDRIMPITNSLDRYGYFILKGSSIGSLIQKKAEIEHFLLNNLF